MQSRVLAFRHRVGPGQPAERYESELGVTRAALHEAVSGLNRLGLLDADVEMGSTWIGGID
jgi:hypothetical protein